jgi:tetratricopeptide (TPR) repeat protein
MKRTLALLALIILPGSVGACLWDTDTLAAEAKGFPEVIQVITGRFERNPPYYYEMRLQRATADIAKNPDNWEAYDDAGVACDWLGRGDEAIAWMGKKRERIDKADASNPRVKKHRYRYLANVGTFWAHRWFRQGANRERIDEMKTAREFTKKAIKLNPDAHFGREKYQLLAMEWIITPPKFDPTDNRLPSFLEASELSVTPADAVRGLSGLIVLGAGWQSIDVYYALARALYDQHKSGVAYIAYLRCAELIDQGRRSLQPGVPTGEALKKLLGGSDKWRWMRYQNDLREDEQAFRQHRAEADRWHAERTRYMMTRLLEGRHPDTDSTFWDDYQDAGPPPLPESTLETMIRIWPWILLSAAVLILTFLALVVLVLVRVQRRRRREFARP